MARQMRTVCTTVLSEPESLGKKCNVPILPAKFFAVVVSRR
jgi:hypothetical protein